METAVCDKMDNDSIVVAVKEYRITKNAKINIEGITLVYGKNGNGKSTLIKALVTMMSNQASDDNFRHGTNAYAIAVRVGNKVLKYFRKDKKTSIQYCQETERTNLGKKPLSVIEPRFPLKRVDYENASFYPNFSFQNSVPIFDDISVYDLFSSMFSSVAKVSGRVTTLRFEAINTSKDKQNLEANLVMAKQEKLKADETLTKLQHEFSIKYQATPEEEYTYLNAIKDKMKKLGEATEEYQAEYDKGYDPESDKLFILTKKALDDGMLNIYDRVQHIKTLLDSKKILIDNLTRDTDQLSKLPDFNLHGDFQNVASILQRKEKFGYIVTRNSKVLQRLPAISGDDVELINKIGSCYSITARLVLQKKEMSLLPAVSVDFNNLITDYTRLIQESNRKVTLISFYNHIPVVDADFIRMVADYEKVKAGLSQEVYDRYDSLNISYSKILKQIKKIGCPYKAQGLCPEVLHAGK